MADERKKRKSGKYCVAGGPGLVSCKNGTYTEGISMHLFPKDEVRRGKWERFVRRHRANFKATNASVLCSVHFEPSCYERALNVAEGQQRRTLKKDAVPTIDGVQYGPSPELSERERRQIIISAIRNVGQLDPQPCSSTTAEPEVPSDVPLQADSFVDEEAPDANAEESTPPTPVSVTSSNVSAAVTPAQPITPISVTDVTAAVTPAQPITPISVTDVTAAVTPAQPITPISVTDVTAAVTPTQPIFTPISVLNVSAAATPVKPACSGCLESRSSARKYQKENSRLRIVNAKLRAEIKLMHDTTASESGEEEENDNDGDNGEDEGDDGGENAALEEEVNQILLEEDEQPAAHLDTGDEDWGSGSHHTETSTGTADEDDGAEGHNYEKVRVEPNTKVEDEPKFIAFFSTLLSLFSMFCFLCRKGKPKVTVTRSGTMAVLTQNCKECGRCFQWRSQPLVLGKYPAGNILLSFGILMAGASVSRVILVLRHMGLAVFSLRTYFLHQRKFLFPVVLHHWEEYRSRLLDQLKGIPGAIWSGDGRFDSMGHSAKYGTYTMFSCDLMKIVHFDILQANQTSSSQAMELQGAKNCFDFLRHAGVAIAVFISDRHRGIAKWMRENHTTTKHYYGIWHIARSIAKKLLKASKEKGYEVIKDWIKGVRNHLYWCTTSTAAGYPEMILAKWWSFLRHVSNKHKNHPDHRFEECAHGDEIEPRKWIKIGSKAHEKLTSILTNTQILKDVQQLSSNAQTSCLEGYHATLNYWHPKMICFSWIGTYCRHILASLHFNENLKRTPRRTEDGRTYTHVTYPKFKQGEEVVREIGVPPTYGYVSEIKKLLFSLPLQTLTRVMEKYKEKVPEPLNTQFPERLERDEAIKRQQTRKRTRAVLFPSAEEQEALQNDEQTESAALPPRKKPRTCATCGKPKRGHPRSGCPYANEISAEVENHSSGTE